MTGGALRTIVVELASCDELPNNSFIDIELVIREKLCPGPAARLRTVHKSNFTDGGTVRVSPGTFIESP
jgi:hypothetical protein